MSLQARKPSGLIGRFVMTKIFNSGNAALNAFVKECLALESRDCVLEIGFGPGKLINEMANITTEGTVEGVDFSKAMINQAQKENIGHIASGRVLLHECECSLLPFEDEAFDKLCSTNTLYFWKKPEDYFAEMFRVLRPGGKVVIGFRDDEQMSNLDLSEDIFNSFSKSDMVDLLTNAGFKEAEVKEKDGVPFVSLCGMAIKA
ncbi:MAG: class I SAM-dependent methyltransferase [Nitrospinae bacterium]|nr:class I SAM-dependent methyltransferase [Nitrospinota bacterium]